MISGNIGTAPLDRMAKWATFIVVFMAVSFPFLPEMPVYVIPLMPLVIFITWLFSVRGYTFLNDTLTIHRPFWDTRIQLPPDAVFKREPEIKKGLIKTAGNGGLFGYTGGFRNKALGNFKAYVTSWSHAVSITSESTGFRAVISPEDPELIQLDEVAR